MTELLDPCLPKLMGFVRTNGSVTYSNLQNSVISNPTTLSKKIKCLISNKWMENDHGVYRLTPQGRTIAEATEILSHLTTQQESQNYELDLPSLIILSLKRYLFVLKSEFENEKFAVVLFGSAARKKYGIDSDLDLFLLFLEEIHFLRIFNRLV